MDESVVIIFAHGTLLRTSHTLPHQHTGSDNDGTLLICRRIPRLFIVYQEGGGPRASREEGLRVSTWALDHGNRHGGAAHPAQQVETLT
jgi:hypothetical protein